MTHVHIFEHAGLGKGPFKLNNVTAEGGFCQFCNTKILFRFYIQGQDTRTFYVGSDCVMKTGDVGLMRVVELEVKKRQAELRRLREAEKFAQLKEFLANSSNNNVLSAKPHPVYFYAKQGKTYLDYANWIMKFGGKTAKLKLAKEVLNVKETGV